MVERPMNGGKRRPDARVRAYRYSRPSTRPAPCYKPTRPPDDRMHPKILVLNGPNLNLLGRASRRSMAGRRLPTSRQPAGGAAPRSTLRSNSGRATTKANSRWIQQARGTYKALIVNAGAYTHWSIAILDALAAADLPVIEVHLSNIFRRAAFRHHSYVSTIGARHDLRLRRLRL